MTDSTKTSPQMPPSLQLLNERVNSEVQRRMGVLLMENLQLSELLKLREEEMNTMRDEIVKLNEQLAKNSLTS